MPRRIAVTCATTAPLLRLFAMMGGNFPLLVAGFMLLGLICGGTCSMSAMVGFLLRPEYYGINCTIATCQMIPAAIVGYQILALSQMGSGSHLPAPSGSSSAWPSRPAIVSLFIKPRRARSRRRRRSAMLPLYMMYCCKTATASTWYTGAMGKRISASIMRRVLAIGGMGAALVFLWCRPVTQRRARLRWR